MSKKYGIRKQDVFNWVIFSKFKVKKGKTKGKIVEKSECFYPTLEKVCIKFLDFKIGKKMIDKSFDAKKILKAIDKAKKEIIKEVRKISEN